MIEFLHNLHITCALLSVSGFALRGYWRLTDNPKLQTKPARIFPHLIDTVLLLSAIGLVFALRFNVLQQPWLIAKITALLLYILLGTIALKRGHTRRVRMTALFMALGVFGFIVGAAVTKSPYSWLSLM